MIATHTMLHTCNETSTERVGISRNSRTNKHESMGHTQFAKRLGPSPGRSRPEGARARAILLVSCKISAFLFPKFLDAGGDSPGDIFGGFGEAKTAPREGTDKRAKSPRRTV
jgi:hypothetical protein